MHHIYEFGPFRLDPRSEVLTRDGQRIHLTAKCYSTLLLLVQRAGALVSKTEILATIWPDGCVEPANLTQTIYMLRKRLGDEPGRFVETVSGRGYRFAQVRAVPGTSSPAVTVDKPGIVRRATRPGSLWLTGIAIAVAATIGLYGSSHPARSAVSPQVQRDYALGRHYWSERTMGSLKLALQYFDAALAIQPRFGLAYSGLADCYSALGYYSPRGPQTMRYFNLARVDALRAVALDPDAAEAHASLAYADEFIAPSYLPEIAREYQKAFALNNGYATAHEWYSWFLFGHGKQQDALAQMIQARDLDPLSPVINFALGNQLYFNRKYQEASDQWHLTIDLFPDAEVGYYGAGLADEALGSDQRAESEFKHALSIAPNDTDALGALAHVYVRAHQTGMARHFLARIALIKPAPAYDIAVVKEALGQQNLALRWLSIAKAQHDGNLMELDVDPRMDNLRSYLSKHGLSYA